MLKYFKRNVQITSGHTQFFLISFNKNVYTIMSRFELFTPNIHPHNCANIFTSQLPNLSLQKQLHKQFHVTDKFIPNFNIIIHSPCICSIQTSTLRSFIENIPENLNLEFTLSHINLRKIFHYKNMDETIYRISVQFLKYNNCLNITVSALPTVT